MRLPTLLTAAGVLAVTALGHSQVLPQLPSAPDQPPKKEKVSPLDEPRLSAPPAVPRSVPNPATRVPQKPLDDFPIGSPQPIRVSPTGAPEQTVEQVIEALEVLKAQKAALEKREKQLAELLKQKLDAQAERVKKLGLPREELKSDTPLQPAEAKPSPRDTSAPLNKLPVDGFLDAPSPEPKR